MIFGRRAIITLIGLTERQLDYWATSGVVKPSVRAATGKGTRREYSFKDLVALKTAKKLKDEGVSLQKIRKSLTWLRKNLPDLKQPLAELRFITNGENIFVLDRDPKKIMDTLRAGQFVFAFALGEMIEDLKGEFRKFAVPKEEQVVIDARSFTVILTPDIEDGGYTVQCKEIPAAISQGETEQEALDNIIDALELCLDHMKELQASEAHSP
jgi:predicted RNase H-like HicB family nuclease